MICFLKSHFDIVFRFIFRLVSIAPCGQRIGERYIFPIFDGLG